MAKKAKLKLDEATIKALMGYSVATGSVKFKPEIEGLDDEFLPIFNVRNLTNKEYTDMKKSVSNIDTSDDEASDIDNENALEQTNAMMELVRKCITGWDNFIDISTAEYVEYEADSKGGCDKELYKLLSDKLKLDIFNFIMKFSGM